MRLPPLAVTAVALVLAATLTGCSSQQEQYCSALEDEEQTLQRLSSGSRNPETGIVAETVDVFQGLRDEAPDDVRDEWDVYLTAWQGLERALTKAGADESMFREGRRPDGMSEQEYEKISAAAVELRSTEVVEAASGIEQHALDVCKVELGGSELGG